MQHVTKQCKVLNFADLGDERGKLVVVEGEQHIPFAIQRVFYIYGSDRDIIRFLTQRGKRETAKQPHRLVRLFACLTFSNARSV